MIEALSRLNIPRKILSIISAMYDEPLFRVVTNEEKSEFATQDTGIRQGCPLSPYLFLFGHSTIMNLVDQQEEENLRYFSWVHSANTPLTQLAYADDTLVIEKTASTASLILQTIEEVAAQFNLRLNRGKM